MESLLPWVVLAAAVTAILILLPGVRRMTGWILNIAIGICSIAFIVLGVSLLLNNVALFEPPGAKARLLRFLTVNQAATSPSGRGSIDCVESTKLAEGSRHVKSQPPVLPGSPAALEEAVEEENDLYPELVQRGYPGIPRPLLFQLAQKVVTQTGGWNLVKADPRTDSLQCTYTSRILHLVDDVEIVVTSRNEIRVCSSSRLGIGDLGANIGHIKEFYAALEPFIDAVYKEEERRENAASQAR